MIYPTFIKSGDTIGICAPSSGVGHKLDEFDQSLNTLKEFGFNIKETKSVRHKTEPSASAAQRGKELNSLFEDKDVDFVMCATGGDYLIEMIPHVDFKTMKKHPKWLMGYSDPTGILFPYTTKCDVATIYGCNAGSYDSSPLFKHLQDNIDIIQGNIVTQKSSTKHTGQPPFLMDEIVFGRSIG